MKEVKLNKNESLFERGLYREKNYCIKKRISQNFQHT